MLGFSFAQSWVYPERRALEQPRLSSSFFRVELSKIKLGFRGLGFSGLGDYNPYIKD